MPNLGGGGAERVVSILLNNIDRRKFAPNLIIIKKSGSNEFVQNLKEDVAIHYLEIKGRIRFSFPFILMKILRFCKAHKPDILFFGSGQINAIFSPFLFLFSNEIKLISRESNLPSIYEKYFIIKWIYKTTYKNYEKIIVQSDDMYNDLNVNFGIPKNKLVKINNPIDYDYIFGKVNEKTAISFSRKKITLLAAGRLTHQKGFDLLVKELSKITEIKFHLYILGSGEMEQKLLNLISSLKLEEKVSLMGVVENPYKYMRNSDVFILSSRFEGFPNVLLESLLCGTPVMANTCLGGITEIIKPGFNGVIFDFKKNNFKEKLQQMSTINFSEKEIINDVKDRFSIKNKIAQFQELFLKQTHQ